MGLKSYTPPVVDVVPATARHRQCGTKIRWPSRWVADNAALLTAWKHPDDETPLVAYACPWCSIPGDPGFHIGHVYRGDQMQFTVPIEQVLECMAWIREVAPELDEKRISRDVAISPSGAIHLRELLKDDDGNFKLNTIGSDIEYRPVTIVLRPDQPPFPYVPFGALELVALREDGTAIDVAEIECSPPEQAWAHIERYLRDPALGVLKIRPVR